MGVVGLTYSLAQSLARYGVTANAIAPAAATRMITGAPGDKQAKASDQPPDARPDLAPENIAPIALYLASERSDWLTGRVLAAQGYQVGLYANPQVIRQLNAPGPWEYESLAAMVETSFRPAADGLPDSIFRRLASS
jgi:hypothetical protein